MRGHRTSHTTYAKIEIVPSIFPDQNGMKLEINSGKNIGKFTNMWKLKTYSWAHGSKEINGKIIMCQRKKSKWKLENILGQIKQNTTYQNKT